MNAEEIFSNADGKNGELSHKLRTVADLVRHIKTKENSSPANYSIFLGAGASVTSGIRTATQLIDEWAKELYERFCNGQTTESAEEAKQYFENKHSSWYNPDNPYSSLFEKKFDLPTQRRRFVEQEVDGRFPSIGYAYLASLVDKNYFNTIFTTNFDDLINEAFYLFSNTRPIVCAHDSSIHSISITSKRPKIVKLHGDYLFDDIKSTLRETESLEQNTKDKFVEFCKEYGLIVVGYSGSDRSIMDVLEFLARQENYLKNGVYWCLRRTDNVCHTLRNLIWKDKVYPVLIDGFDELFAEIHCQTVRGELKLNSSKRQSKLHQTIHNIVSDKFNLSNNQTISQEILSIKNDGDSKDISEFIKQISSANESSKVGMTDVRNLLEIDALIEGADFLKAEETCCMYYESATKPDDRKFYIEKYIDIYQKLGADQKVSFWCDKLLEIDPNNIEYHLKKARSIGNLADRIEYLSETIRTFKYSTSLLNSISSNLTHLTRGGERSDAERNIEMAKEYLEKSLNIDPSLDNLAWSLKIELLSFEFFHSYDATKKAAIKDSIADHIKLARTRHPEHQQTLDITRQQLNISCDKSELKGFLEFLFELAKNSPIVKRRKIHSLIAQSFEHIYEIDDNISLKSDLKDFIEECLDPDAKSIHIAMAKIRYWSSVANEKDLAVSELNSLLERKRLGAHVSDILKLPLAFTKQTLDILQEKLEEEKHELRKNYYFETLSDLHLCKCEYDVADQHLEAAYKEGISFKSYMTSKTYLLLLAEKYSQVINLAMRHAAKLEAKESESIHINIQCAAKKSGNKLFNEILLRNLSAQSSSDDVKICAFSLLDKPLDAKRMIKKKLDMDSGLLFKYKRWPALSSDCFPNEADQLDVVSA
ncbi:MULTISPECIES: SIR2 family protein [unclassified Pseudomonas]|uniref:SIR2 family protein n=1 Tax=unclassified Pseudomonas TaxID=196821 RepID=UPI001CBC0AD9|nr:MULTISPECIES: SIR2 family protein [unclassified Pseudomonas]